ncbi:uncharacterized protein SOCE26_064910 [Sorangium cellulosum]|uniref:Uncharacterized protein n=1 Tax=Sorangium cellulosum TaxID=56 RepID=A0A2L0F0C5_SORCE|nr:hypothetical protein [Sorangium cellulosum]AUX45012.1 uncharacterized protein SOCE26_064910 [Sorangium cellulosum]
MCLPSLAALAWASACGGNVVVDGFSSSADGAGAGTPGATSTSASGIGGTNVQTSVSSGEGGGDPGVLCELYCGIFEETCGDGGGACRDLCEWLLVQAPECNYLLVPYLNCATTEVNAGQCEAVRQPACEELLQPYAECGPGFRCRSGECSGSGGDGRR